MLLQLTVVATIVGNLGLIGLLGSSEEMQVIGEYCQWETFEPHCDGADVIIMRSALYGRMRAGRCVETEGRLVDVIKNDPLYLGCSADVLPVVDSRCSGQSRCYFKVAEFRSTRPCYVGLEMYLDASYSCARVVENEKTCTVTVPDQPIHISLAQGHATQCGTPSRPWRFEATPGEHLRLNLLQFKRTPATVESFQQDQPHRLRPAATSLEANEACLPVGYLKETPKSTKSTICAARNRRNTFLYESSANTVDVVLTLEDQGIANSLRTGRFFISFEVVGCPDLLPESDAWMTRSGGGAVFGCLRTHHTWHLKCTGREWSGVVGNCTRQAALADIGRAENDDLVVKQALLITIIIGSCLAIFLTAICTRILVLQRREKNSRLKSERAKCASELTYTYGTVHRLGVQTARISPKRTRTVFIQTGEFHSRTVRTSHNTLTSTNEIYFRTLPNNRFSVLRRAFDRDIDDL